MLGIKKQESIRYIPMFPPLNFTKNNLPFSPLYHAAQVISQNICGSSNPQTHIHIPGQSPGETKMKESVLTACRGSVLHMKQGSFIVKEREQHMVSTVDRLSSQGSHLLDPWNHNYIFYLFILYLFVFSLISLSLSTT
jgi:hypothetical protein